MQMAFYRIFAHTADLGVEVTGRTADELFAHAVQALFDLLTDLSKVRVTTQKKLSIDGTDWSDLWVNTLRECLYLFNGEGILVREVKVRVAEATHLEADLWGEPYNPRRHRLKTEIKAVTYHQASVAEGAAGWMGKVVFDV